MALFRTFLVRNQERFFSSFTRDSVTGKLNSMYGGKARLFSYEESKSKDFLAWAAERGIRAPKLTIKSVSYDGGKTSQYGVFAKEKIAKGEIIAVIPFSTLMCRNFHPNQKLVSITDSLYTYDIPPVRPLTSKEILNEPDPILSMYAPNLQLAIFLIMEYYNEKSTWRPYLNMLPDPRTPVQNAQFLSEEKIREVLTKSFVQPSADDLADLKINTDLESMILNCQKYCRDNQEILNHLMVEHPVLNTMLIRLSKAKFEGNMVEVRQAFLWAMSIVNSRSNVSLKSSNISMLNKLQPYMHIPPEFKTKYDHFYAQRDGKKFIKPESSSKPVNINYKELPVITSPFLAPFLDIFNHGAPNVEFIAAPLPPYSQVQKRTLKKAFKKVMSDEDFLKIGDLSRYLMLVAINNVDKEELKLEYVSPFNFSNDVFLSIYGFVPKPLTVDQKLEYLKRLESAKENEEFVAKNRERMDARWLEEDAKFEANKAPGGIFDHDENLKKELSILEDLGIDALVSKDKISSSAELEWYDSHYEAPWTHAAKSTENTPITNSHPVTPVPIPSVENSIVDRWFELSLSAFSKDISNNAWYDVSREETADSRLKYSIYLRRGKNSKFNFSRFANNKTILRKMRNARNMIKLSSDVLKTEKTAL